jgi:hypothetical protein
MPTDSQFLDGTSDIQRLAILRAAEAQGTYVSPLTDACFKDATEDVQRLEILRAIEGISGGGGGTGTVTSITGGTGLTGGTITTSGTLAVSYGTSAGTAAEGNDSRLSDARIPTGSAGGDLAGTYPNPTVDGLQGNPVSNATPSNGQTLQWNGSAWVPGAIPSGGAGGGGLVYYLNYQNTTGISPTTGLPTSPVAVSQLGRNYSVGSGSITSANLTNGSYSLVCGFVTIVGEPNVTEIPAGLWDFNIWADVSASSGAQTQFQIRIYKYDSTAGTYTSLANSDDVFIYDPAIIAQYIANVTMPQTTILATDRIYVELWAQKNVSGSRQVSFYFDSLHPSHCHTTLPSVSGSGVVKVVNGVFQSPASTIVNADVSATAAIEVSKLSQATNRILGRTTTGTGSVEELSVAGNLTLASGTLTSTSTDIQIFTSSGTWTKPANAKSVNIQLLGGGGGGGAGNKNVAGTNRSGGGGGGGGGYLNVTIPATVLPSTSINITIGAGGAGGAASTVDGATGPNGTTGGSTIFGTGISGSLTYIATGGLGGNGGSSSIGGGGNGSLNANSGSQGNVGSGAAGQPTVPNGAHFMGGAGGGGGGGINNSNTEGSASNGGRSNILNLAGGPLGSAGANNTNAVNGLIAVGSGGGGGGGSRTVQNNGGTGGFPSSGGGGGSGSEATNSGAGGTGGAGMAIITTYF